MLTVDQLITSYGEFAALKGVSLRLDEGEVITVLGGNAAGKTTLLKSIIGLLKPHAGAVIFMGNDVSGSAAHQMVARGLSLVPEGRQLFSSLTVLQNLKLGMYHRRGMTGLDVDRELGWVFQVFPILKERLKQRAGTLSGGQQQMLAIARALVSKPKLLLLDEPSQGLAPLVVEEIFRTLSELHKTGLSILLVEQQALLALQLASRCYIMETGKITVEGTCEEIMKDTRIVDAYLGRAGS